MSIPGSNNFSATAARSKPYASSCTQLGHNDDDSIISDADERSKTIDRYGFYADDKDEFSEKSSQMPVSLLREREKKWLRMLENWPHFVTKNFAKIKSRCRKGIPPAIRARAWKYLCGAQYSMTAPATKDMFKDCDQESGDPHWVEDIQKDLHRQFPTHELFSRTGTYGKLGQEELFRVLKAWTVLYPSEGYCQGQAPVAATLLMHMPVHEAFFCFTQLCTKYVPGYYSVGLEQIQLDGAVLNGLLRKHARPIYKHLKHQGVEPSLYMVEWFMCLYARTLPWPTVLRVWDIFFAEGVKILFKVALVLVKCVLGNKQVRKECPGMFETLERLRSLPSDITNEEFLIRKVIELDLPDEDLEREHYQQVKARRKKAVEINASVKR